MGFRQMLGSVGATTKFMAELTAFSAKTPFEFPGLLESSRQMMAMQWQTERIIPDLKTIGDALAGIGKFGPESVQGVVWALGKMKMYGRVSAREMMMLVNQGIPAWQILADEMGKTTAEVRELSEKGLIPAEAAIGALLKGMDKRFGGMMQNLENSWYGVTSTIKDVFKLTIGEMTKNLFKNVNQWLVKVKDFAQRFYDALKAGGLQNAIREVFGAGAAANFAVLSSSIKGLWNFFIGFFSFIKSNWNIFGPMIKGALLLYVSLKYVIFAFNTSVRAMEIFTLVQKALAGESLITSGILGFVSKAMGIYRLQMHLAAMQGIVLTGVLGKVRVALYSVWTALGPVGWAVLAIAGVLGVGIGLWNRYNASLQRTSQTASQADIAKGFRDVEKSSQGAADGINDQTDAMEKSKKAARDNIMAFDEVHQLQEDMGDAASDAGLDMPTLDEIAMPDVTDIMAGLEDGLEMAKPTLAGFWNWIKQGFVDTWDWVKEKTGLSWQGILMAISGPIGLTAALVIKYWDEIKGYLSTTWNWISGLATGIFGPIGTFISSTWKNLLTTTVDIWDSIWTFISNTWNNLWTTATTIWNSIWTFLSDLWGNIKQTASIIWQAIADLITGKIDLRTAVTTIWNAIKDFFFNTWSGIRDTASDIWGAIAGFIIGTWQDLKTTAENIWNEIATFFYDTWDNLKLTAQQVWETIKDYIVSPIQAAWERLREIFGNIKTYTLGKWDEIKQGISSRAQPLIDAIKSPFNIAKDWIAGIIDDAYNWGKNLIENITKGIKATVGKVKDAVVGVVDTVKGYIGFSSPTKEGPGRYADEWAPNLIRMYAEGIIRNTGLVESAASGVAGSLSGMSRAPSTPAFAGATAGAAPEIHLHVGTLIADDYGLKKLEQRLRNIRIYEDQRVGDTR